MKIISLNAWQGKQGKELEAYLRQHSEDTHVFCFQEAEGHCDALRSELLPKWQSLTARSYDYHYKMEVVLTTCFTTDFELLAAGTLSAPDREKRSSLWVHLKKEKEEYWICNVHGSAFPEDKNDSPARLGQSQDIIDFLRDKKGQRIVMGDFNLNPDTESVKMFEAAGYRNLIRDYEIDTTRNEISWAKYPDNKQLFADYTFVGPEVAVKSFQVPKNEASDHLPMELEIE
jgi:endonuclease/exonuclease/phosphatase family metal-dependent hydrolase